MNRSATKLRLLTGTRSRLQFQTVNKEILVMNTAIPDNGLYSYTVHLTVYDQLS